MNNKTGHILVVDDNQTNRMMLSMTLQRQGHQVAMAENGRQALQMLREEAFDLMLLDIVMPHMNGYQVLETMKADAELRHIPVIVVSGLEGIEAASKCIEMGAVDHLPRSFDPVLLQARIRSGLERKRFRDQEVAYLQQVTQLTEAATAVEVQSFDPDSLADIAAREDELGTLARIFRHMAEEVQRRENQLRQDNEVKAAFIDVISHELRSPFASAAFSVELLQKYAERDMMPELLAQIAQLDKELSNGRDLIETIINFATQARQSQTLNKAPTDFNQLVQENVDSLTPFADEHQLTIEQDYQTNLPLLTIDRQRIGLAIYHLLHNAIKFNRSNGRVALKSEAENNVLTFEVRDTGKGIEAAKMETIWQPFAQEADDVRRGVEGLGLGLALTRTAVAAHRGKVFAQSKVGQGSLFGFRLPIP